MSKATVTRLWVGGLIASAAGIAVALAGTGFMLTLAGTWSGPRSSAQFTPSYAPLFWGMVGMIAAGGLVVLAGGIVQFAAWIGALVNTARAPDKVWFVLLLVLGILGFGLPMMIVYLVGGPDVPARIPTAPPSYWPPAPPVAQWRAT
jgi:hypothetical protein